MAIATNVVSAISASEARHRRLFRVGLGRIDRAWRALPEARRSIPEPPSAYQRRLYYDSVVGSEEALRFLLDRVGADRVVLSSDWPFVPWYPSPVRWVEGLASLSRDEKDQILWRNL